MTTVLQPWDIFCKVIDNYGDIGVSWRLARRLAAQNLRVRLWVDDLASFQRLVPAIQIEFSCQQIGQVELKHWPQDFPHIETHELADVVIEAFGCALPAAYLSAMAARVEDGGIAPVWINLEYLSAESWVETHHGLPSPHPSLPLMKYFFFPGFAEKTGGLLTEHGLHRQRRQFQNDPAAQNTFWQLLGLQAPSADERRISMFAYPQCTVFQSWLEHWVRLDRPTTLLIPEGVLADALQRWWSAPLPVQQPMQRGSLRILIFPFLGQDDYDRLLWACDINFVRGEDSFVRAQWAAKPFVWQIYPQEEGAHIVKLDAFIERYTQAWPDAEADTLRRAWYAWNGLDVTDTVSALAAFEKTAPALVGHAEQWVKQVSALGDLATNLMRFAEAHAY